MSISGPVVSTIIPSYNHANYISEAIESVISQDYANHELIIVDDGSKDNSRDVISRYSDHPLVTIIFNAQNCGQSRSLLNGLAVAKGEFICLLPSDDWILPGRISSQVAKFLSSPDDVGIVYGPGLRYFEATGETRPVDLPLLRGDQFERLLVEEFIYPVTPMIRRACYERFPPDTRMSAEGEALWTKFALEWKIEFVEQPVGVMRHHGYNCGRNYKRNYLEAVEYWERWFSDPETPSRARLKRAQKMFAQHRMGGLTLLMDAGEGKLARKALRAAVKERPTALLTDWKLAAGLMLAHVGYSRISEDPLSQVVE